MAIIETTLTRLPSIEHPILLAPMGSAAGGRLAAAVTNAGGLGRRAMADDLARQGLAQRLLCALERSGGGAGGGSEAAGGGPFDAIKMGDLRSGQETGPLPPTGHI
jgi:NAD(P)H-dependent flavin oxidoreductase YrpB (nitropropane dioxygenase family)